MPNNLRVLMYNKIKNYKPNNLSITLYYSDSKT